MPMSDGTLERRIRSAAPHPDVPDDALDRIVGRKHRRAVLRKVGTIATIVVVIGGTLAAFAAVGAGPAEQPAAPPSPVGVLGLPYPVCDVTTMPITTPLGQGTAAVFTRADHGCPKQLGSDDFVGVGVDLDGDGNLDATTGPVPDCFTRCEAFAAPDVNADGTPEIAVSTEGADGYRVFLYAVTTSPPSIAPITKGGDAFAFEWTAIATQTFSASCATSSSGEPTFVLENAVFGPGDASVDSVFFSIQGTIATKVDEAHSTVPLNQAPAPTDVLCGAEIHGSAGGGTG